MNRSVTIETIPYMAVPSIFSYSTDDNVADDEQEEYMFNVSEGDVLLNQQISRIPSKKRLAKESARSSSKPFLYHFSSYGSMCPSVSLAEVALQSPSSSPPPSQRYEESRTLRLKKLIAKDRKRSQNRLIVLGLILAFLVIVFSVLMFSAMPLTSILVKKVENIVELPDVYEFDLILSAANSNMFPIAIIATDLDVFASSVPEYDNMIRITSEELLGHVRYLNNSAVFISNSFSDRVACKVSIEDPSNTFGKLIYLRYPYILTIRGTFLYSSFLLQMLAVFHHQINLCETYRVISETEAFHEQCE